MYDAAIIGGGPAGATAGRLLAAWGYSVIIMTPAPGPRPRLAECLPPSTVKLFDYLGIREQIDNAGFLRTSGNTVWWGGKRRVEPYPGGRGYQVPRDAFDALLLSLARGAGARVAIGKVRGADAGIEFDSGAKRRKVNARFILDCSGRAAVLGRAYRLKESPSRTIALCGVWSSSAGWKLPDATHTLIEAYADGWAWSIPLSPTTRHVAFMVGPSETKMSRGAGLAAAYQAEFAKTRALRRIFAHGVLQQAPWGCDASLYASRRYAGPGFLIVGDAGSFIDPLSSFGVKKAMVSGWIAAVVVNTCLSQSEMQDAAIEFFNQRESQVSAAYQYSTASWFRAAGRDPHPFWTHRSDSSKQIQDHRATIQQAFEKLRREQHIRLRLAEGVRLEARPALDGRLIVLRKAFVAPDSREYLDFFENVNLPLLAKLAGRHNQVPHLFSAYNRSTTPVALPDFLKALSMLIERRILIDES